MGPPTHSVVKRAPSTEFTEAAAADAATLQRKRAQRGTAGWQAGLGYVPVSEHCFDSSLGNNTRILLKSVQWACASLSDREFGKTGYSPSSPSCFMIL